MPWASNFNILKYNDGVFSQAEDLVVEERRVEIFVNGRAYVSVMASPDQLDYLAMGYLFTEGAIQNVGEIKSLAVEGVQVRVELHGQLPPAPLRARSCGFGLGSVAIRDIEGFSLDKAAPPPLIQAERIVDLMERFNQMSQLFWQTGAVHSAWLVNGSRTYFAEDVGRHNALDKVIGHYLSEPAPGGEAGLMFSTGRISAEMLLKTAKAGLSALISRGSASQLAVDLAEKAGLVLIGFARGEGFKAFCGGQYLSAADDSEAPHA